ncbi:HAD family hydrolase, partial [Acinetobacter baumannii]
QYDILGARHNGIEAVAVTYGYGTAEALAQAQPQAMINQFSELLVYVEELAAQKKVS